jgi:hypothetical protein
MSVAEVGKGSHDQSQSGHLSLGKKMTMMTMRWGLHGDQMLGSTTKRRTLGGQWKSPASEPKREYAGFRWGYVVFAEMHDLAVIVCATNTVVVAVARARY